MISVSYMNYDNNSSEDDDDVDFEDRESDKGEEDYPLWSIVISLTTNLQNHEKDHIIQIQPPRDSYVGVPFVHCLTITNLNNKHVMVCF